MLKKALFCFLLCTNLSHAQGCVVGGIHSKANYVCYDGRTLELSARGYVWNAKRGCFLSSLPCCEYNATHYAFSPQASTLARSFHRCQRDYPFRLGEMQTH